MKRREVEIIQRDGRLIAYCSGDMHPTSLTKLARECRFNATELCIRLGVSERNLRRVFETGIGIGPKEWLRQERMVVARNLLLEGAAIKEVADELGFANYKNLSREFQSFYGVTASDYQRKELSIRKEAAV